MIESELNDRIAVVTGASSGIGAAIARTLSAAGATVVLVARREHELMQLAGELPGDSLTIPCDVSVEHDAAEIARLTLAAFGRIDILINNAGVGSFAPVVDTTLDDWRRMLDVNVTGSFLCARAVLPAMIERGSGTIVNVCSDVSRRVFAGGAAYCASKHAQYAFSLALGAEMRPRGITVGAVLPGMVQTAFAGGDADATDSWSLRPQDVADAVHYMVTRPAHSVIDELTVHPVRQDY